jgi:hypothetical protein
VYTRLGFGFRLYSRIVISNSKIRQDVISSEFTFLVCDDRIRGRVVFIHVLRLPDCSMAIFSSAPSIPRTVLSTRYRLCFWPLSSGNQLFDQYILHFINRTKCQSMTPRTYHSDVVTIQKCLTHLSLRDTTRRDLAIRQSKCMIDQ